MARAVMRLFEGVQLAFGPTVDNGFYYDFQMEHALSDEDFPRIEAEMARIVAENEPFERVEMDRERGDRSSSRTWANRSRSSTSARAWPRRPPCRSIGRASSSTCAAVRTCRRPARSGPSNSSPWPGPIGRAMPSGSSCSGSTAPPGLRKQDLEAHLQQVEEAKRRDHRVLGKQLELFLIDPAVGSGPRAVAAQGGGRPPATGKLPLRRAARRGYLPVYTPVIGNVHLYETSGHYPYYKDSQFPPIEMDEGERYLLRPMNCPHHMTIYQSKPRSYRELPLRLAEFGTVHRYEQSGELSGMTRVRGFTQDDAHIFCTEEQVADEFRGCLEMTRFVLKTLGLDDYRVRLGFSDPASDKYVGSPETWQRAEAALEEVCREHGPAQPEHRAGRGGLLRPQGRLRGGRLHRPRVAVGHRAVGLQPAQSAAVRPGVHRRRQPSPSAGDDPPGPVRLVRAVRGDADRALCRGLSACGWRRSRPG